MGGLHRVGSFSPPSPWPSSVSESAPAPSPPHTPPHPCSTCRLASNRMEAWRVEYAAVREAEREKERKGRRTLNVLKKYARNVSSAHYGATTHVVEEEEGEEGEVEAERRVVV